jgi:hypothetical protein
MLTLNSILRNAIVCAASFDAFSYAQSECNIEFPKFQSTHFKNLVILADMPHNDAIVGIFLFSPENAVLMQLQERRTS